MKPVAVFDIESTGIDVETARIVTAFFGVLDAEGNVIEAHNWMVRPDGYEIPEEATAVHGVTTEQALKEGSHPSDVMLDICEKLDEVGKLGVPLCGHNLSYDLTVLDRELPRVWREPSLFGRVDAYLEDVVVLDSLVIDKHIDPYRKGKRTLITAAEHYGVELSEEEAHGAQADAIASGRIIQVILSKHGLADSYGPKALHEAQKEWKREQAKSLQHYFRTKADPPQPDAVVNGDWPYIPRKENS